MKSSVWTVFRALLPVLVALLSWGCIMVRGPSPWIENGQARGTISYVFTPNSVIYRYTDYAGLLRRVETRNLNEALLPGPCTVQYEYDAQRRLIEERSLDAMNKPVPNAHGYARKTYAYSLDAGGNTVVDQCLFDIQDKPASGRDGYAYAKIVYSGAVVAEVSLYDENQRPVAGAWDGVPGVTRVKYMSVEGIGDVRYGVYYDLAGKVIARNRLSGAVASSMGVTKPGGGGPRPPRPPRPPRLR